MTILHSLYPFQCSNSIFDIQCHRNPFSFLKHHRFQQGAKDIFFLSWHVLMNFIMCPSMGCISKWGKSVVCSTLPLLEFSVLKMRQLHSTLFLIVSCALFYLLLSRYQTQCIRYYMQPAIFIKLQPSFSAKEGIPYIFVSAL